MAKKKSDLTNIFAATEPAPGKQPPQADPFQSRGIGLRSSEWARFEAIAKELGTNAHAVSAWALRDFLKRYQAGEIATETRKSLPDI